MTTSPFLRDICSTFRLTLRKNALFVGTGLLALSSVSAQVSTWTGAGGANNNWSNAANWTGTVPTTGGSSTTELVFTFSDPATLTTSTNNLSGTFQLNRLAISATSGLGKTIAPPAASPDTKLSFVNNGGVGPRIEQNGTIASTITVPIDIDNGINLTLGGTGGANAAITLSGAITGGGSITVENIPWVLGNANSTFSGGITVTGGQLVVSASSTGTAGAVTSGAFGTGKVTLQGGILRSTNTGVVTINNDVDIGGNVGFGNSTPATSKLTLGGAITLTGGTVRTITLGGSTAAAAPVVLAGVIGESGGSSGFTLAGTGILELSGTAANTYTGVTTVNSANATLLLNKTNANAIAGDLTITTGTVRLAQSNQIADTSSLTVNGTLDLNGNSETVGSLAGSTLGLITSSVSGPSVLTIGGASTTQFFYNGSIQDGAGTVGLIKQGTDIVILTGTNSYSGGTTLNSGQIVVDNNSALGSGVVTLNGGILRTRDTVSSSRTINNALEINGDVQFGTANTQSTLTFNGATTLLGNGVNRTISASASASSGNMNPVVFAGAIGDGGNNNGVTIQGIAANVKVVFAGTNTYTGATIVNSGTLIINGSTHASSAVTVKSGATVGGSGAIHGSLTVENGGNVALSTSPETFEVDGAFALEAGGTLAMKLNGATAGTGYDQLLVGGAIDLAGNLNISLAYSPVAGTNFFLINNLGGGNITGNFAGLAQGATFLAGGQLFQISYLGDAGTNSFTGGNDVVIQAIPEPATLGLLGIGALALACMLRRRND